MSNEEPKKENEIHNLTVLLSVALTKDEFDLMQIQQSSINYGNNIMKLIRSKNAGVLTHPKVTKYWNQKGIAYSAQLEPSNISVEFELWENFEVNSKKIKFIDRDYPKDAPKDNIDKVAKDEGFLGRVQINKRKFGGLFFVESNGIQPVEVNWPSLEEQLEMDEQDLAEKEDPTDEDTENSSQHYESDEDQGADGFGIDPNRD